jgi:hypothetical protein
MDKVFQILVVFALLMLVITYSVRVREKKFRPFFLYKTISVANPEDPDWDAIAMRLFSSGPGGTVIDQENELSFRAGEGAAISVTELSTGDTLTTIIPEEQADCLAFDPAARLIHSYCREGAMTIIRQNGRDRYTIVQRMLVPKNGSALAIDPQTGKIYLAAGGSVFVYANS